MPQPLSKVCSKATVSFHLVHSTNKPALATLVTAIFARWAMIEHWVSFLLLHVLGAEARAKPALAMFSVLKNDRQQMEALEAAAKVALPRTSSKFSRRSGRSSGACRLTGTVSPIGFGELARNCPTQSSLRIQCI